MVCYEVGYLEYNSGMIGLLIGANCIVAIGIALRWSVLPPQVPLFYSLPTGEDQLVEWWMIFILPFLMNILVLLNLFIASRISIQNMFVHSVLRYTNYAIILTLVYVFLRIVFLVT